MPRRCGSEWSAQIERTTPTHFDGVGRPSRWGRGRAGRAGEEQWASGEPARPRGARSRGGAGGEHRAGEGARSEARLGDEHPPRVAPASRGEEEGAGRRQTRGAGRAVRTSGRHQGRGGAEAEPGAHGGGGPSRGARGVAAASWRKKIRCRGKKEKKIEDDTWGPYVTVANGVKCRSIPSLRIPPTKQKTGFDPTLQPNTNWVQPNPKIWVGLNPSPIQTHA